MKFLALDTSTDYLSIAVQWEDCVREFHAAVGNTHSQRILPVIAQLLAEVGGHLHGLDALVVGEGPGAFTGLRIGCGVAQGLAAGADLPIIPISTLLATAQGSSANAVVVCLDARMHEVYTLTAQRTSHATWDILSPARVCAPSEVPLLPTDICAEWVGVGYGFSTYAAELKARLPTLHHTLPEQQPQARALLALAAPAWIQGAYCTPEALSPVYVRDKVAMTTAERVARTC